MTPSHLALAAGLGLVSALLLGGLAAGSFAGLLLFVLAPLPLGVAGLGYGPLAALVAALAGALAIAVAFDAGLGAFHLAAFGAPVALLAREALRGGRAEVPRLLAGLGALSVGLVFLAVVTSDTNHAAYLAGAARAFAELMRDLPLPETGLTREDVAAAFARVAAPIAVVALFGALAFNLWLASRLLAVSGRLSVPLPSMPDELAVSRGDLLAAGGVAMVLELLPGWPGFAGTLVLTALSVALALHGLAAAHALSRGSSARGPVLGALYIFLFVAGPAVLGGLALLGVADALFGLRARAARRLPRSPT